jgi:hypothetical protein cdifA_19763
MSLIKCPECGKEISDKTVSCPNCGYPIENTAIPPQDSINNQIPVNPPVKQKRKGAGCLIPLFILFIACAIFAIQMAKKNNPENATSSSKSVSTDSESMTAKYLDLGEKKNKALDKQLKKCGIDDVKNVTHDELLDNAHFKGETGYRVEAVYNNTAFKIILYLDKDKKAYTIKYMDYDLLKEKKVVATLKDYTLTMDEATALQISCQSKVEEILKSPSTAKFPSIDKWGMQKEKNKVTIQGYVDSQNSFGAELRSEFQFVIDTKTSTIKSFIFDGKELIK